MTDIEDLKIAVAQYVSDRDAYAERYKNRNSGLFNTEASQLRFNELMNGHAEHLRGILPPMNLVELEGFSELVYVLLNRTRQYHIKK